MTKKSDRKSPPRLGPLYDNIRLLEQLRIHPDYADGAFIDAAADAAFLVEAAAKAGHRRRATISKSTQYLIHETVAAQVALTGESAAYPVLPASPYTQLTETFQKLAETREKSEIES